MASITVDVSEAVAKLDPRDLEKAIKAALVDAGNELRAPLQVYPPPKPTYRQTGTLGRGWGAPLIVRDRQVILQNNVAYGPYVQDADHQAWFHKGRWKTAQATAKAKAGDIKELVEVVGSAFP